jgi:hypothetical protein
MPSQKLSQRLRVVFTENSESRSQVEAAVKERLHQELQIPCKPPETETYTLVTTWRDPVQLSMEMYAQQVNAVELACGVDILTEFRVVSR